MKKTTRVKRAGKRSPKRQALVSRAKANKRRGSGVTERVVLVSSVSHQSMFLIRMLSELSRLGPREDRFDEALDSVIELGGTAMLAGIVTSDGTDRRALRVSRKVARQMEKDYPGWKSPVSRK